METLKNIEIYKSKNWKEELFSIVVPVYNVEKWLPKCLDSISNQTDKHFELVLVDDGATDNSGKICQEYAETHDNVVVIHKKNGGLVSARNAGVMHASGKYICPVDGDDWIDKDYIKCLYWTVEKHVEDEASLDMIILTHKTIYKDREEIHVPIDTVGIMDREYLEKNVFTYIFMITTFLSAWSIVCNTELLKSHLCKNETIKMHEDFAYTYELFYHANTVFVSQKVLYYYNQLNTNSITHINGLSDNFLSRLRTIIYIYSNMKECEKYIKDQLCISFFTIMINDFYECESFAEVKRFRRELTPEHSENIYVCTAIIFALLNKEITHHRTIWWCTFLMFYGNFRILWLMARAHKRRYSRKLIY